MVSLNFNRMHLPWCCCWCCYCLLLLLLLYMYIFYHVCWVTAHKRNTHTHITNTRRKKITTIDIYENGEHWHTMPSKQMKAYFVVWYCVWCTWFFFLLAPNFILIFYRFCFSLKFVGILLQLIHCKHQSLNGVHTQIGMFALKLTFCVLK